MSIFTLYGGQRWFYPGMLVPRSYGFDLYHPNAWQNSPTSAAMDPGPAQRQTLNGSSYLSLTFTGAAADVTYTVQATSALDGAWTTLATYHGQSALGTFTVPDAQPASASAGRFMRLQVSHAP